jgi:hypothetical protein
VILLPEYPLMKFSTTRTQFFPIQTCCCCSPLFWVWHHPPTSLETSFTSLQTLLCSTPETCQVLSVSSLKISLPLTIFISGASFLIQTFITSFLYYGTSLSVFVLVNNLFFPSLLCRAASYLLNSCSRTLKVGPFFFFF